MPRSPLSARFDSLNFLWGESKLKTLSPLDFALVPFFKPWVVEFVLRIEGFEALIPRSRSSAR
ncbi:hypothetical protein DsansV1_C07g0070091 [Dioscorea sansibarensis]